MISPPSEVESRRREQGDNTGAVARSPRLLSQSEFPETPVVVFSGGRPIRVYFLCSEKHTRTHTQITECVTCALSAQGQRECVSLRFVGFT